MHDHPAASRSEHLSSRFTVVGPDGPRELDAYTEEGFWALADLFTRASWQNCSYGKVMWMGQPILQLAEDVLLLAEVLWLVRPDVVLESGVAFGGTTLLVATVLEATGQGRVIGFDVQPRPGVAEALSEHPLGGRIELIEASSTDPATLEMLGSRIGSEERVLVILDSDHSHQHVLTELEAYAPLVSPGSYLVAFDGCMEQVADAPLADASWRADNPLRAIKEFLSRHPEFEIDTRYERLGATFAPSGWLRRIP